VPGLVVGLSRPAAWVLLCLTLLAAMVPPAAARADGDPASDFLLTEPSFVPFNRPAQPQIDRLNATLAAAKQRGYTLRVAVIGSPSDLGSVPEEFGRPAAYAAFLDAELQSAYTGRLLVVMPQGYGFRVHTRPDPAAAKLLARVPPPADASPDTLMAAATVAVRRLAAGAGVHVPVIPLKSSGGFTNPGTTGGSSGGGSSFGRFLLLLGAGLAVLGAIVLAILFWPGHGDDDPD
jgi:hypothetical protein